MLLKLLPVPSAVHWRAYIMSFTDTCPWGMLFNVGASENGSVTSIYKKGSPTAYYLIIWMQLLTIVLGYVIFPYFWIGQSPAPPSSYTAIFFPQNSLDTDKHLKIISFK